MFTINFVCECVQSKQCVCEYRLLVINLLLYLSSTISFVFEKSCEEIIFHSKIPWKVQTHRAHGKSWEVLLVESNTTQKVKPPWRRKVRGEL